MKKLRVLVVAGGEDRDFPGRGKTIQAILTERGRLSVSLTDDPKVLNGTNLSKYDVCVFYASAVKLNKGQEKTLMSFVRRGGGLVGLLHASSLSHKQNTGLAEVFGCSFAGSAVTADFPLEIRDPAHPLMRRMTDFCVEDELIRIRSRRGIHTLLETYWRGEMLPVAYTHAYGQGRVFFLTLGHNEETLRNKDIKLLLTRACLWTGRTLPETEEDIRGVIVGYDAGARSRHAEFLKSTTGLNLVAVCDDDPKLREAAESDFPGVELYSDVRQLLLRAQFDLAVVLLPSDRRGSVAMQCLKAGRHVVVRAPMSLTTKEAGNLISAAQNRKLVLSVYSRHRLDGEFAAIRDVAAGGAIGRIFRVEAFQGSYTRPVGASEIDSGPGRTIYDRGSELISGILELIPEKISSVTGFFQKSVWHHLTVEDDAQAIIKFESGAVGDLQVSSVASVRKANWRILGTKGGIMSPGHENMLTVVTPSGETRLPFSKNDKHTYYINVANHLHEGESSDTHVDLERSVISVIEAVGRSAASGHPERASR